MTDFRKRLLSITVVAMAFAGLSYGQGITACSAGNGTGTPSVTPGPTNMRSEGTTELAGDITFNCTNTTGSTTATVSVFASAPITSQLLTNNASGATLTEAALFICAPGAVTCTSGTSTAGPIYGTASGTQLSFTGITIPATGFNGRIYNVRMNANAVTIGSTLTTATEQVLVSANNTSAATLATTVGFIFKSLVAPGLVANPNGGTSVTLTAYTACAGNALPATGNLTTLSFGVTVGETFGGAFKVGNGLGITNGEGGSFIGTGGAGSANSGTKIQLVIANVASAMTVYVPTAISNTLTGGNVLALTLVSSPTAADPVTPVAASTTTGAPAAGTSLAPGYTTENFGASAAFTPSNGTVTVVYEVTSSQPTFIQSAVVPVWVTFGKNVFTTAPAQLTVLESYAPVAAAAAATTVPNFAPPTNTALPATLVNLCQTSLLFPFVTSVAGFDTGIALSNTSTDPFGTTPAPGTCSLNFYGSGAPTPSTAVAAPGGTQASGTSNAFLLSSVAPGFTGYMIAQCNYNLGHGFAYIVYNFGQNSGATMGYLALQLERGGVGSSEQSLQ